MLLRILQLYIWLMFTCKAPNRYSAKRAFFRLVKDTFDKEKIEIPYTTVDINVRK